MAKVFSNGLDFEVEVSGPASAPAVVLVMGLGMQLTAWPDALVETIVAGGFRVIRFDNRDCGLSSKIEAAGRPNILMALLKQFLGMRITASYLLADMAADTVGILDALAIDRAHLVGISMGGMIAQEVAARFPARVRSLTSIMSSSGARDLPGPSAKARRAILSRAPDRKDFNALVEHFVGVFTVIGSPGFPTDIALMRSRLRASLKRSFYPVGTARQLMAITASGDRSDQLRKIATPTTVMHGADDPLVKLACGEDCAAQIAGAKLVVIPGMGHDLAPGLVPLFAEAILQRCAA